MMSKISLEAIEKRIALIMKCLNRLKQFERSSLKEYLNDFDQQLIAERLLQLIIESASDINSDLLVQIYRDTPDTYLNSFIKAGEHGIIEPQLAKNLAQSAGLYNQLVYQYAEINPSIVFTSITDAINGFTEYVRQIHRYINNLDNPS